MPRPRFLRVAPLLLALASLPVVACGGTMEANVEAPGGVDYAQYSSFRWITDDLVLIQSGTGNERIRNIDNEKRIRAAVERGLAAKGVTKGGADADLVVAFTVGTKVRYRLEGDDYSTVVIDGPGGTVTRGTLTLYFFDPKDSRQVWQAWTSKDLEPGEDPDAVINGAVDLLLSQYPPAK